MKIYPEKMKLYSAAQSFPIDGKAAVRFVVSSETGGMVSIADDETGEITPIMHFKPGELFSRAIVVKKGTELIFEPSGKKPISLAVDIRPLMKGEMQDFNPPPEPPEANNLLAKIREKVRKEMGVTRESFLLQNDTGYPGHEIDDEEPSLFEEEMAAIAAEKQNTAEGDLKSEARRAEENFSETTSNEDKKVSETEK